MRLCFVQLLESRCFALGYITHHDVTGVGEQRVAVSSLTWSVACLAANTSHRKCSKQLVHQVVTNRKWREHDVSIPDDVMSASESVVYYRNSNDRDFPQVAISPETGDALLQALAFWSFVLKTTRKT